MMTLITLQTLLATIDDAVDSDTKVRIKIDNVEYRIDAIQFVDLKTDVVIFTATLSENTLEYMKGVIDSFDNLVMMNRFMHILPEHIPELEELAIKVVTTTDSLTAFNIYSIAVVTEYYGSSSDEFIVINN